MRVDQFAVDPGLCLLLQLFGNQFPSRQHELTALTFDVVAVNVYVSELILLTQGLHLVVGLEQRSVVPQTDVSNCIRLIQQVGGGQLAGGIEIFADDVVQTKGRPRKVNVVCNEFSLARKLIGVYLKALNHTGIEIARDSGNSDPTNKHDDDCPPRLLQENVYQ